jgi:hypothetical protein
MPAFPVPAAVSKRNCFAAMHGCSARTNPSAHRGPRASRVYRKCVVMVKAAEIPVPVL